ncbi:MAG: hypothetical protein Q7U68_07840 [Candidatus Roizmanbacteria bacterium]|nr:hypothetical protein [Candidatus Roizmanbacteria bacterium]
MKFIIFYSWQSDLPNNTNRGFLESVIQKAIGLIGSDENFEIEPSLDRDTQGTPGSPNISQTIIDKIKACDVFVADISIVTGSKEIKQRLSPNPNVLIELGYAISCLGWEKIILFCNELYGSDEDLPFDIRQHRRIPYSLKPEDEKASLRESLSKLFKERLTEIIQNSTFTSKTKRPELIPEWNYWGKEIINGELQGIDAKNLQLKLPPSIENIEKVIEENINEVRSIDGSIDPKWEDKVAAFISSCRKFIEKLETKKGKEDYFINTNLKLSKSITLSVSNNGTLPASDIRVEILVPHELCVFEEWPDKNDNSEIPQMPKPEAPRNALRVGDAFTRNFAAIYPRPFLSNINLNQNRTSGFYLKNNKMVFWADKLLHKHTIVGKDRLHLLAKPDSKPGVYKINCNMFCVEYDDWDTVPLTVEILE